MSEERRPPIKHWMKHTAAIPKGFLRYWVLRLLSQRPMSGAEIIEEIEEATAGCWRPSPGSMYPLLAWLQDNKYIVEVPTEEAGVKRYTLTDHGKQLLEEQNKLKERLERKLRFIAPPLITLLLHVPHEETRALRESVSRLFSSLFELKNNLEKKFSKEMLKEVRKALDQASQRIEEINRKLREKQ